MPEVKGQLEVKTTIRVDKYDVSGEFIETVEKEHTQACTPAEARRLGFTEEQVKEALDGTDDSLS